MNQSKPETHLGPQLPALWDVINHIYRYTAVKTAFQNKKIFLAFMTYKVIVYSYTHLVCNVFFVCLVLFNRKYDEKVNSLCYKNSCMYDMCMYICIECVCTIVQFTYIL